MMRFLVRIRMRDSDRPLLLLIVAAIVALGLWGKDYVAAQGSGRGVEHAGYPNPRIVGSASNLGQPASAAPFDDWQAGAYRRVGVEGKPQGITAENRTRWGNNAPSDHGEIPDPRLSNHHQKEVMPNRPKHGKEAGADVTTGAAHPKNAETSWGTYKATAFVLYRSDGPLREFIVKFDLPDIPNREGWR